MGYNTSEAALKVNVVAAFESKRMALVWLAIIVMCNDKSEELDLDGKVFETDSEVDLELEENKE